MSDELKEIIEQSEYISASESQSTNMMKDRARRIAKLATKLISAEPEKETPSPFPPLTPGNWKLVPPGLIQGVDEEGKAVTIADADYSSQSKDRATCNGQVLANAKSLMHALYKVITSPSKEAAQEAADALTAAGVDMEGVNTGEMEPGPMVPSINYCRTLLYQSLMKEVRVTMILGDGNYRTGYVSEITTKRFRMLSESEYLYIEDITKINLLDSV